MGVSGLSAAELLKLADTGASSNVAERGLLLLEAALPELTEEEVLGVGLGARAAVVLELRYGTFGDKLSVRISCPVCDTLLSTEISREELGMRLLEPADPLALADDVIEQVGDALLAADPQAEVRVDLTCAVCGHAWSPVLDPVPFFWRELTAASAQILDDVHQLAAGYGWSEEEVLRLSSCRRRRYVERLLGA